MKKRLLSALLLFSLLACAPGCAESAGKNAETTPDTTPPISTEDTAETELSDNLPDENFDGYKFTFYTRECCSHVDGIYQEEDSADIVDSAVYMRNQRVGERFNVTIAEPLTGTDGEATVLRNAIAAQDSICDATIWHFRHLGDLALEGYLYDLNTIPHIDFSKPWWSSYLIDSYSIFGKSYVAMGYYDVDNITLTGSLYFNKRLAENYLDTNLYETVHNGAWTLDELIRVSRLVGDDLNGDGKIKIEDDLFGFGTAAGFMFMFQSAADQPTTQRDADGIPELVINTERMATIVEKTYDLLHNSPYNHVEEGGIFKTFTEGRVLIHTGLLDDSMRAETRDMTDSFGILPFPKFDEAQEEYRSHGSAHCSLIGVPITVSELERTGILIEALAAQGYKDIRPAVYDVALKSKLVRDEESAEMIDIILDGRTGDFADIYDEWGLVYTLDHMVGRSKNKNFASYYAGNHKATERRIAKAVEKFEQMS